MAHEYVRVLGQALAGQQVGQVLARLVQLLLLLVVVVVAVVMWRLLLHQRIEGSGLAEPVAVGGNLSGLTGAILLCDLLPDKKELQRECKTGLIEFASPGAEGFR